MRTFKTNFGNIYIEEPSDNLDDKERYTLYDSEHRWFDYFLIESVEESWNTYEDFYNELNAKLEKMESIDDILDYFGISYECCSKDWREIANEIFEGEKYTSEKDLLENEYVNVIGDHYILICD